MRLAKSLLVGAMAMLAAPALAEPVQWSSAVTAQGTATVEVPCSEQSVQKRERDGLEAIRCDHAGLINYLFVMPVEMLAKFNFPGGSISEIRANIAADAGTEYLNDGSVSGFQGFYSEGMSSSGKVALGVVDLRDGRYVMLNVQSDGSAEAEQAISDVFVRSSGSLQVVQP